MSMLPRLLIAAAMLAPVPALAQPAGGPPERVNQVIVYGDDACPAGNGEDIVVCARMPEEERYRIPSELRGNPNDIRYESWTARVIAVERVGRTGTDSCSPVGLGGFTGCMNQTIENAYAERREAGRVDWTQAVADERRRRAEGIDAAAADEEAQANADDAARAAQQRAAAAAAEDEEEAAAGADPLPDPAAVPR